MQKFVISLPGLLVLAGCSATPSSSPYASLGLSEGELLKPQWQSLTRYQARFPIEEARNGNDGCATISYVILPDNSVQDLQVESFTSRHFAKQAKESVQSWKWAELPSGLIAQPVRTRTRFEFCLEQGDGHCQAEKLREYGHCQGEDVVYSIAHRIKHP